MAAMRIALAQFDFPVAAVEANAAQVIERASHARDALAADLILFPELTLTGYPPEDLLLRDELYPRLEAALGQMATATRASDVVLGLPERSADGRRFNAAVLLRDGAVAARYHKWRLPNYGVFDEKRYFEAGDRPCLVEVAGCRLALTLCEDLWGEGPMAAAAQAGAELVLNLNASPFHLAKGHQREATLRARQREAALPIAYANLVGGQDELVFDGESFVIAADGNVTHRFGAFEEGLLVADFERAASGALVPRPSRALAAPLEPEESVWRALVRAVRDYVDKNGFPGALIGLSGGIDSALTLAIAVDALGAERVEAVLLPSRYTQPMSLEDARRQAERQGVAHRTLSIEPTFTALLETLQEPFAGLPVDTTEENLQARCRGVLLMALSNKSGRIVLTTGNKSEMAVGYATLYGDMAGGFAVLKDVPKTLVYRLARWRNRDREVIPKRVIERPPSAELAPDQKDSDSLPPYELLDAIIEQYVEQDASIEAMVAAGLDRATVERVVRLIDRNEYKRRQAAPGPRITHRAFSRDRRYPITRR